MPNWPRRLLSGDVDDALRALQTAVSAGRGCVVLFSGAPGSGKSTTLSRLVEAIDSRVPLVSWVTADETSRRQPFGVISALVGMTLEYPPRPDTADRVLVAVENLCADGPAVLCAEDLHHADADSLRVLRQLVEATRDLPLVLLLTRRLFPIRESLDLLAAQPGVLSIEIIGVDADGVADLVRQRCGADPGPRLLHALQTAGGNPFHILGLLADLQRHDQIQVDGSVAEVAGTGPAMSSPVLPSMQGSVRAQLSQLTGSAHDLLEILAVWGRPAPVQVLATLAGVAPAELSTTIAGAIEVEVVHWTTDETLSFTHDLYREVLYADLLPGLRRMLHAACAAELRETGGIATEIVQHVGDSLVDGVAVAEALRTAEKDLRFAPEQAADLLAQVQTRPGSRDADAVAIARAGALAAAGRMNDVVQVAREALAVTSDVRTHNTLTRLLLHSMVSSAQMTQSLAVIDDELRRSHDANYRDALIHLRRWMLVLTGDANLSGGRTSGTGTSGAALVPSSVELYLQARCVSALETVLAAQQAREKGGTPLWADGATAQIWPGLFALYARGPVVAAQYSVEARRVAQSTGRGWLFPQHLGVAGEIDQFAGRWDDALTLFGAQMEIAADAGSGWRGRGMAGLLQIQIHRGSLDEAADALQEWHRVGHPDQFGVPWIGFAELQLLEARGETAEVRRRARRIWDAPIQSGLILWALLAGPDMARIALRTGDASLLEQVRTDTAAVPLDEVPVLASVPDLVAAIATADTTRAATAAAALRASGSAVGELYGWEESAVAAAVANDREAARTFATRCQNMATSLGAQTVTRRLAARLRDHGVRLGVTGTRGRPASGMASLTRTELVVAQRVSQGLTSPQIAAELFLSPRTVQTHISHILRKLDLRSRVELAALFARTVVQAG